MSLPKIVDIIDTNTGEIVATTVSDLCPRKNDVVEAGKKRYRVHEVVYRFSSDGTILEKIEVLVEEI